MCYVFQCANESLVSGLPPPGCLCLWIPPSYTSLIGWGPVLNEEKVHLERCSYSGRMHKSREPQTGQRGTFRCRHSHGFGETVMVEGLEWGLGFVRLCPTVGRERETLGVCFGKQEEGKHVDK